VLAYDVRKFICLRPPSIPQIHMLTEEGIILSVLNRSLMCFWKPRHIPVVSVIEYDDCLECP
jgi:hypothetical protein